MRKPSIKTLERAFPGRGVYLRHLLDNTRAVNENPAVIEWADSCYHEPPTYEKRLCAINNAIDGYGVEYVPHGSNARSPGFSYINMGDTYTTTIVRIDGGRYCVTDIGSIIERGNYA